MLKLIVACALVVGQTPYVDEAKQGQLRTLWDLSGLEFPSGLKFYEFPIASQHVAILATGGGDRDLCVVYNPHPKTPWFFDTSGRPSKDVNAMNLWRVGGGLHESPRNQWVSYKGVSLPDKVSVWREPVVVPNAAHKLPAWRWEFPNGTIFVDMLVRRSGNTGWPFEIRTREKRGGQWESTAYRPWATEQELPAGSVAKNWTVRTSGEDRLRLLEVSRLDITGWSVPDFQQPMKLKRSRLTFTSDSDGGFFPRGYAGAMVNCNTCHRNAGVSSDYAAMIRGSDTVFSWHPYAWESISQNGTERPTKFNNSLPLKSR